MYMYVCIHMQYRNLIATIIKEQLIPDTTVLRLL